MNKVRKWKWRLINAKGIISETGISETTVSESKKVSSKLCVCMGILWGIFAFLWGIEIKLVTIILRTEQKYSDQLFLFPVICLLLLHDFAYGKLKHYA